MATMISTMTKVKPVFEVLSERITAMPMSTDDFSPTKHLNFEAPTRTYSMSDIKLANSPISDFAVSEPFQLFTPEAVARMRAEVFDPEVMKTYAVSSNLAHSQLRGFSSKAAPFIDSIWKNPDTLAIVSKIAGIDLVPIMDYEVAHINLSSKSGAEVAAEMATINDRRLTNAVQGNDGNPWEDDKPIVDWHTDSYPFVCVTMLSDCTTMLGGETALRTGDGSIVKVRGPQMGCAVILQGRYIEHQALRAFGSAERITCVTSFRPKNPFLQDDTVLTTVRPISDLSDLYSQFSEYRLEMLEERIRDQLKSLRNISRTPKRFDTQLMKSFLKEQEEFLAHMNKQLVPDELVTKGNIDDSHLFSEQSLSKKRRHAQEQA